MPEDLGGGLTGTQSNTTPGSAVFSHSGSFRLTYPVQVLSRDYILSLEDFARVPPAVISLTSCAGGSARITNRNPIKNNCWQRCVCAKHVLEAQISRYGDVARLYPELEAVARVLLVLISLTSCAGGSGSWADRKPIKYNCW